MKSLIRWSTVLTLAGGVLLSTIAGATRALALPDEQVMERLRPVPVFALTDREGSPLVAAPEEGQDRPPVAGVFISRQDALNFLDQLKTNNPQLADGVQVVPVSLAEVYQLAQRAKEQDSPVEFAFIPGDQQVQAAETVLQQSGQATQDFRGVPLFVARSQGEDGAYLTIRQGEKEVIPMFFSQAELQAMLTRLQEVQPELASSMDVQVVNLEGLIQTLQSSDNAELNQIVLIPPRESVDFVRSLQQTPAPQGQPQPQPQP